MKRIFTIILLSALTTVASAHLVPGCIAVDFSGITTPIDVTLPNSYALNGVTLSYDNFGSTGDTAAIEPGCLCGSTYGSLILDFSAPATELYFDFSLLGAVPTVSDGLFITFKNNGEDIADMLVAADLADQNGDASGSLAYIGVEFNQALMFFSMEAPEFCVTDICYQPVPEPATIALLCIGALSLLRRKKIA